MGFVIVNVVADVVTLVALVLLIRVLLRTGR